MTLFKSIEGFSGRAPSVLCATLFALSLAVITVGCDRIKTHTAAEHVQRAKELQNKDQHSAAVIELKNALEKNPADKEARRLLGETYVALGEAQGAEKELRRAIELGLSPESVKVPLGRALLLQGEFQKTLTILEPGTSGKDSETAQALALQGEALLGLARIQDATVAFTRALDKQPGYPDALLGLARIALGENDFEKAKGLVEQVLAANPKSMESWLLNGEIDRLQGRSEDAIASFSKAVELKPGSVAPRIYRAQTLLALGRLEEGQKDIAAAREIAPNNPLPTYMQAYVEFTNGKHKEALESVQKILRVAPDNLHALLLAGAVQLSLGALEQAEASLKQVLSQAPENIYARKLMAATLLKSSQPQRAVEALQPALKQQTDDVQLLALAGEAYFKTKQFAKAAEYLEKAATVDPANAAVRTALGIGRLGLGDSERAIADLEAAADIDAGLGQADELLVATLMRKGEFDKALTAARKLEKKQTANPLVHNLIGGIYLGMKDVASARKAFEKAVQLQPDFHPAALNLANLDLQAKDQASAHKRFETILAKDPKNLRAMIALAELDAKTGKPKEAVEWLEKARQANPGAAEPRVALANYYANTGDRQKALNIANEARAAHPRDPQVLDTLGQVQLAAGEKSAALATYSQLAGLAPRAPSAHFRLATAQIANDNPQVARDSLRTALQLKPNYLEAEVALARLDLQAGRHEEASALARQVQQQYGKSPIGYALEGDVHLRQQRYAQAAKAYEIGYSLGKNAALAIGIDLANAQGEPRKSTYTRLIAWLKDNPGDLGSRLYLANGYMQQQQDSAAMEQYQQVLQKDPDNLLALNNLASLMGKQKDPRAVEYAEKAYKLKPGNAAFGDTLGWILLEQGKTARALELLRKAVAAAPKHAEIRYHFAVALEKSGDKTGAKKELESLLASDSQFAQRADAELLLKRL